MSNIYFGIDLGTGNSSISYIVDTLRLAQSEFSYYHVRKLEFEVLRCGWKIDRKNVIKPKVFEVMEKVQITATLRAG